MLFQVIEWLKLDDNRRPSIINLYLEEPDGSGHKGGPGSEEVRLNRIKLRHKKFFKLSF